MQSGFGQLPSLSVKNIKGVEQSGHWGRLISILSSASFPMYRNTGIQSTPSYLNLRPGYDCGLPDIGSGHLCSSSLFNSLRCRHATITRTMVDIAIPRRAKREIRAHPAVNGRGDCWPIHANWTMRFSAGQRKPHAVRTILPVISARMSPAASFKNTNATSRAFMRGLYKERGSIMTPFGRIGGWINRNRKLQPKAVRSKRRLQHSERCGGNSKRIGGRKSPVRRSGILKKHLTYYGGQYYYTHALISGLKLSPQSHLERFSLRDGCLYTLRFLLEL